MTVIDELDARASERPDGGAVVFPEGRLSWSQLRDAVTRLGGSLRGIGVRPGDNVAIMLPNSMDNAVALLAIMSVGATAVPFNLRSREHELNHLLGDSRSVALLTSGAAPGEAFSADASLRAVLPDLDDQAPGDLHVPSAPDLRSIVWLAGTPLPGGVARDEFDRRGEAVVAEPVVIEPEHLAMIMYTSGTTASPKGAMISHRAVLAQAKAIGGWAYRMTADDRFWTPLPLFHTGGIMSLMACIATGATYHHSGAFEPGAAIDLLERERITIGMPVFEPIWLPVLEHPRFAAADLSSLRMVQTAGSLETQRRMQARFPQATNLQSTGMTEATSYMAFNRAEDPEEVRLGTGGYPMPTLEIRIVDPDTGTALPPGERGEAQLRGEGMFSGYFGDPELTAASYTEDGWFRTGDIGVIDEGGRYTWVGRSKDMLKVGGENVAAAEIEDYLARHPAVLLSQVVAAPDARLVEVPAAYIQLRAEAAATEQEIIDFCLGRIATFKVPRYVRFVAAAEWPMSGTKIQKFRLRERIAQELAAAGIETAPRPSARRA